MTAPARPAVPAAADGDDAWVVIVKTPAMRRWEYLGRGGRLTTRPERAQLGTMEGAQQAAATIAFRNHRVQAWAVPAAAGGRHGPVD